MKDVTQAIKEARDRGHLLVTVEMDWGYRPAGTTPYLLVYANDLTLEEPNSVSSSLQRYDPSAEGSQSSQSQHLLRGSNLSPELRGRMRREAAPLSDSIQNNELPEVEYRPDGYSKDDLWESTWYLALKPKPKSGRQEKKRKSHEEEEGREEAQVVKEAGRTSEVLKSSGSTKRSKDSRTAAVDERRNERRNEGRSAKRHKGVTQTESAVLNFDEHTMRKARRRQWGDAQHPGCARRNLRVDFADIGWSEWVIAPKAFDAFYCSGTCGFPVPKVSAQTSRSLCFQTSM